ncbi:MAG: hypothetical protein AB7O97_15995 [Planctomycetota bacterium]
MNARALTLLGLAVAACIGGAAMWWQGRDRAALRPSEADLRSSTPATGVAAAARGAGAPAGADLRTAVGAPRAVQVRGRLGDAAIEAAQLEWDGVRVEVDRAAGTFSVAAPAGGAHRLRGSWRDARGLHLVERDVHLPEDATDHDVGALATGAGATAQLRVVPRIEGAAELDAAGLAALGRGRQLARVGLPHGEWSLQFGETVTLHGVPAGGLQVRVVDAPPSMRVRRRLLRWDGPTQGRVDPGGALELEVSYLADRSLALVARCVDARAARVVVRLPDPGTGRPATLQFPLTAQDGVMLATGKVPFGPGAGPAVLVAEDAEGTRLAFALLQVPAGAAAGSLHVDLAPLLPATGAGAEPGGVVVLALAAWPELPLWRARADGRGDYAIPDAPADAALVQVRQERAPLALITARDGGGLHLRPGP